MRERTFIMQLKSTSVFLTILFYLLFVPFFSNAGSFQENPLTKAIQLFDKEKYTEAEVLFKNLLDKRPDDFMVNYFYGACRTENGHYSDQDLSYLIKASKEVSPLNIDYYFGVQYHAKNQWEKALVYYKLYQKGASVNDQEKVNLSKKMVQCSNKINPFVNAEMVEKTDNSATALDPATTVAVSPENIAAPETKPEVTSTATVDSAISDPVETGNLIIAVQALDLETDSTLNITEYQQDAVAEQHAVEEQKIELIQQKPAEEVINFNINNEITYIFVSNFKTEEGKIYFREGTRKQTELTDVVNETEILRDKYKSAKSRSEKDSIGQQILTFENQMYELNGVVNQMFLQAKTAENGYWQNATPEETERFLGELNAAAKELNSKNTVKTESETITPELIVMPVLVEKEEVKNDKPVAKNSGIIYKIQIGAYSRGIPNNQKQAFSKISVIRKVENYTDANGVVVYTTGNLTSYDDAVVMQNQVRQEGIKDPIIAAYLNGKRITLEQAKEIENKK
jgi:hypothetical protein